jgi:[ribosomal protein S5]-alanine N-acetyltransferase
MQMIETTRLLIKPLTYSQLVKYTRADYSLEEELGIKPSLHTISPELKEALENTILPHTADSSKNYFYSTLWTLILKDENRMVGDLCFMGEPGIDGAVEVGYGTYEEFRKSGYMTEAIGAMIEWAKQQSEIKVIIASTEMTNKASYSVLLKNGFIKSGESGSLINWQLQLK